MVVVVVEEGGGGGSRGEEVGGEVEEAGVEVGEVVRVGVVV